MDSRGIPSKMKTRPSGRTVELKINLLSMYHKKWRNHNMANRNSALIQHIQETSDLFWRLQRKHDQYFLEKYKSVIEDTFVLLISKMNTWELRRALRLRDNYFNSLLRVELTKRLAKVKLLKARGRLMRQGVQVCLI